MNLAGFDLYRYRLPLREPLTLKDVTLRRREGLLLRLSRRRRFGRLGRDRTAPRL